MPALKKVVVLGATGNVGRPIVSALATADFQVTAASRSPPSTDSPLPSNVKTAIIDYTNHPQLVDLFKQHEVVIEAFNPAAAALQPAIVDACLEAGIKRIITPDFACDTFNKHARELRIYDPKIDAQKQLEEKIKGTDLTWTAIITGGWFDWAIPIGWFWIQPTSKTVLVYGSGDQKYSIGKVGTAGRATIEVLNEPETYKNRPVYVDDYTVSTNEMIPLLEELDPGWKVERMEMGGFMQMAEKLWDEDTGKGVTNRLATPAYAMLGTVGHFDEENRYEADFSHKAEPGYRKGLEELKEDFREILCRPCVPRQM